MKLLTFILDDQQKLGIETAEGIIDVAATLGETLDMMALIHSGEEGLHKLKERLADLVPVFVDKKGITYGPAVTKPRKIICVGLNYKKHAEETKMGFPDYPVLFNKFDNALTGHLAEIAVPKQTERLDYEVELGIVIGKQAKEVSEDEALDHVFGYCTTNDLSARDVQKRTSQFMSGKTFDGFAPVGPYLVTKDEIADPDNLRVTTKLNGELRQDGNTNDMIFNCRELISYISNHMTLYPGDLIMTGTPEGVILGMPMEERIYMQPGDIVTVEVEGLGALTNSFVTD